MHALRWFASVLLIATTLSACAAEGEGDGEGNGDPSAGVGAGSGGAAAPGGAGDSSGSTNATGGAGGSPVVVAPPTGGTTAPPTAGSGAGEGGASGSAGSAGSGGMTGEAGAAGDPTGPVDGDPTKPIVAIDGLACGPSMAGPSGGNIEVAGRRLIVDYPCEKHEGAQVTMILNLHGTLIMGAPYAYQHGYFSAHRLVTSHNLIVLTPQSVSTVSYGAQWGNMDNGEDVPYLLELIDWAYTTFSKFQIRGLWVGGHSWGAAFVTASLGGGPFACHPMLEDKVKGAIGMSRLGMPSCASRLSLIATRGETENIALLDQDSVATGHGCMSPMQGPEMVGNNEYRHFAGCSPGFVHEDYHMLGKGHIDSMDPEVVEKIVDAIKSTEQ